MVNGGPVQKNVEAALLGTKVIRRMRGDVPYPVEDTGASSSAHDIWDTMFFRSVCQSLTMHQFSKPPAVVLDLGCGSGYWAIEAAKEWPNTTIVGFDIRNVQPRLFALRAYEDIAHRVKWVHGNLLDGLPFSAEHFDFVRIVNIGLGVPEDEWQFVLEEVSRVMKPGAALEVIEEDQIFPCAQVPRPWTRPRPSTISADFLPSNSSLSTLSSTLSGKSSTTLTSDSWSATLDEKFDLHSPTSTLTFDSISPASTGRPTNPQLMNNDTNPYYTPPRESMSDPSHTPDLRDHSKLKAAWDAMLSSRFIASNALSVLPFYLSTYFDEIQSHPPLKVILPSNSGVDITSRSSLDSFFGTSTIGESVSSTPLRPSLSRRTSRSDTARPVVKAECPYRTLWANMHLASTVHKVTSCKEAIWREYEKLYDSEEPPVVRTSRPNNMHVTITKSSIRESFDNEWASWQNDMADRIGMRSELTSQLGWAEKPGDRPDWRVWRSKVQFHTNASRSFDSVLTSTSATERRDICRSLCGWVGWKP
ncbi:hypothetical protein H0H81_006884 [Sphagnurus paluster]|uniref:Methyltransferase domain-containing protein n=1 Tax=Sphagnurus paluster TaxID=117069 RepID=A0A9P7GS05_9AGAR|nr:hypothetical protein H0H81_006884 [Sphagnurus paluster]